MGKKLSFIAFTSSSSSVLVEIGCAHRNLSGNISAISNTAVNYIGEYDAVVEIKDGTLEPSEEYRSTNSTEVQIYVTHQH